MKFLTELLKDYCAAYRIAVSTYRKLPIHFFGASLFLLLIVGLDTLTPYLLRETTNSLSSAGAVGYASSAVFLAGAYGIFWTTTRVFEWLKTMVSRGNTDTDVMQAFQGVLRTDHPCRFRLPSERRRRCHGVDCVTEQICLQFDHVHVVLDHLRLPSPSIVLRRTLFCGE